MDGPQLHVPDPGDGGRVPQVVRDRAGAQRSPGVQGGAVPEAPGRATSRQLVLEAGCAQPSERGGVDLLKAGSTSARRGAARRRPRRPRSPRCRLTVRTRSGRPIPARSARPAPVARRRDTSTAAQHRCHHQRRPWRAARRRSPRPRPRCRGRARCRRHQRNQGNPRSSPAAAPQPRSRRARRAPRRASRDASR